MSRPDQSGGRYVVLLEIGLTANSYGADIRTSAPMAQADAEALAARVVSGDEPELYRPGSEALVLDPPGGRGYLVVERPRLRPQTLTRISVARVHSSP